MKVKKSSMLKEHKELLKVLKNPTKKNINKEIKEQGEEFKKLKKK
jgi:hypothetical protein